MERFLTSGIQRAMLYERKLGQTHVPKRRKPAAKKQTSNEQEGTIVLLIQFWSLFKHCRPTDQVFRQSLMCFPSN